MSQCSQSTDGFIKTLFGPRVAVLCSQDAEIISRRNNLSFAELIRPFCTINNEIQVQDPTNQPHVIRDLHVSMCDVRINLPDENAIRQLLSDVVADASNAAESSKSMSIDGFRYQVNVNMSCPWFEAYRDTLTSLASQKLHEFINHCLACLLVVSSLNPNPVEEFANLSQQQNRIQHTSQNSHLRWMTPNTLKYYVLLHDNSSSDLEKSRSVMNDLQAMYGNACYLLRINSREADDEQQLPDPWSRFLNRKPVVTLSEANGIVMKDLDPEQSHEVSVSNEKWMNELKNSSTSHKGYGCCLTLADHDSLREFLQEFASKGLIPHTEKLIRNFNEQITSRKALHRSLFRATKTLFGGGKASSAPALKNFGGGGYESPEMQMRKLADLFFLCQMFEHAYHYYHSVRKEFSNEQAWLHAAGASEMAALSNFMQLRAQRAYPAHYVDSAIDTYASASTDDYLATRCALISLECLRTQGMYAEAATQILRLTNGVNDLQNAVILEQVAQCFLRTKKPLLRKFAFHIVLAGHRYGKALQWTCALMCYKSALQVYNGTGWSLAIDHINFTIGRQSFSLKQLENAVHSYEQLLKDSKQSAPQQAMFLNEYLNVSKRQSENTNSITRLPLPYILQSRTILRNTQQAEASLEGQSWNFLENSLKAVSNKQQLMFKVKKSTLKIVVNEPLWVDITLSNPLRIPLTLCDVSLILKFDEAPVDDTKIEIPKIAEFTIADESERVLSFCIIPRETGFINIEGISYKLSIGKSLSFTFPLNIAYIELAGEQLFEDTNLNVQVCAPMPKLDVAFDLYPLKMHCGEIKPNKVMLTNVGQCNMKNIKVAFDTSSLCTFTSTDQTLSFAKSHFLQAASYSSAENQYVVQDIHHSELKPGEHFELLLWLQGPMLEDKHSLNLMFYYEPVEDIKNQMSYRTLKYSSDIYTRHSLNLSSSLIKENCLEGVLVSAEVKNVSLTGYFHCNKLSCSSASWKISAIASSEGVKLDRGQTTSLYFHAKDRFFISEQTKHFQSINLVLSESGDDLNENEDNSHFCQSQNIKVVAQNGKIVKPQPVDYVVVALEWTSQEQESMGQHYMHLFELENDTSSLSKIGLFADSDTTDDSNQSLVALHQLVKWKFDFSRTVTHDFKKSGLCFVLVEVVIQNQYNCELRVSVNGMDSNQTQKIGNISSNTRFLWTSKSHSKFIIQPKSSHCISMKACFSAPGIYNLNSFSVWAVPLRIEKKTPSLPQNCHYPCLITVYDSNYTLLDC